MITADRPQARLQRFVAAYKLRLAQKAEELRSLPESWGQNHTISLKAEEQLVAGDGQYRLSPYPYPGLRSFGPQEGEIFFGRERNVTDVQKRLVTERTVVVLGGSGSGKSSLLRAGLLPFLNTTRRIPGRDGSWYRAEFRPRTDPLAELLDSLVNQWLLPLFDQNLPALNQAMGLLPNMPKSQARAMLHDYLRARFFQGAEPRSREEILGALLDVASHQLDEYDRLASHGLRVPGPSLILLLDQFEEVFRPEVGSKARDALLNLIVDLHRSRAERSKDGLFLAITMRSEELHLCAEHRGLSDVINRSSYLLELLDPDDPADQPDLHRAIVQPARNAFEDWGLEYDPNCPDAPFEPGMPDWLLEGAKRSSSEIEHRPDQLPLLQHALQATWHAAMRRWSDIEAEDDQPKIKRTDLPGQDIDHTQPPDLGSCLRVRADRAAERAAGRFARITGTSNAVGMAALQAAFRALARRDDRGAWVRRFADPEEMQAFMAADIIFVDKTKGVARGEALRQSLNVFLLRGYLSGGDGRPYDISHEAHIRNWPKFREWLQGPEEVTYALNRVLREVESKSFRVADDAEKMQRIPGEVSLKIRMLGKRGLPEKWAEDQIAPSLCNSALQERWGENAHETLKEVIALSALADDARQRAELTRQEGAIARAREEAAQKQREGELMQARELAEARKKTNRRTLIGLTAAILLAIFALSQAYFLQVEKNRAEVEKNRADEKSRIATLQTQLARVNSLNIQKNYLETRANTNLGFIFELQRDRQRGLTEKTVDQAEELAAKAQKSRDDLLREANKLDTGQTETIAQIRVENERIWSSSLSKGYREKIIANVVEGLDSLAYKPLETKLRVALYAVAAIPQENAALNDSLRRIIEENRQRSHFTAPSASQIWGLAFTERTSGQLAAIGDDNGVVWIGDPLAGPAGMAKKTLTAAGGVVNGLAFNADGTLLAAAYRNGGAVVWDLDKTKKDVLCPLRRTGENSDAYGVAFSGKLLAVASGDRAVHLWDVSQPGCPAVPGKIFHRNDLVFGVAFSPNGKLLAAASGDGTVAVWDINSPDRPLLDSTIGDPMFAVAFSPDGKTLAATGAQGTGYLWNVEAQEKFTLRNDKLRSEGGTVGQISFSPNGEMVVATARRDGTAIVTDVKSGDRHFVLEGAGQGLFGVAFSPDSKYLLTGSNLLNTARLLAIAGDQLGGVTGRDKLIALGLQRIAGKQLDQGTSDNSDDECSILRKMQIPIFQIAEWDDKDRSLVCPFPFLGKD